MDTKGELHIEAWGSGQAVVMVHGSLATAADEWHQQAPLAAEGYRLVAFDRRGYGRSPAAEGEDYLRDADDIAELVGDGAHVVAHSYGGLGAMVAAAQRPEAIHSLALLEPPAFTTAGDDDDANRLVDGVRSIWNEDASDRAWLERFLGAVGTDPASLPPGFLDEVAPMVPVVRRGRPVWDQELPVAALRSASFPKLVVSGGHSDGFDAVCDALAARIDAPRAEVAGAGHEIQFTGAPVNRELLDLWRNAGR
jgi:pimeloyl-ACP methyl ester carboxylesterase